MTVQRTITGYARGDDWKIRRTITPGIPEEGIYKAYFYLKKDHYTEDAYADISKTVTEATDLNTVGRVLATGADPDGDGVAVVEFRFLKTETKNLAQGRNNYAYVIRVETPSGILNTPEKGFFQLV